MEQKTAPPKKKGLSGKAAVGDKLGVRGAESSDG